MKVHRLAIAAILSALALAFVGSGVITMTATAAGPAQSRTIQSQVAHVKYLGTTRFTTGSQAPIKENKAVDIGARANRPIPGKTGRSAPNVGVPDVTALDITNGNPNGFKTGKGINAYDNRFINGFNVTPPDQEMCVGGRFIIEGGNIVHAVFNTNFTRLSSDTSLETFFGYPVGDFNVGDPKCYFDPEAQRFFVTVYDSDFATYSQVDIAVSQTANPLLGWNLYAVDDTDTGEPNCPCFGDQPLLGASRDALFLSTNQYGMVAGFNGANIYALDKRALALGLQQINSAVFHVGLEYPNPDGDCILSGGIFCWYSTQPAISPDKASWDNRNSGTEYLLSGLDFQNLNDNRVALWAVTNTASIRGLPNLALTEVTLASNAYGMPFPNGTYAVQKNDGNLPAGQFYYGWNPSDGAGPIQTNDDRMNGTAYAGGQIWGALNTIVNETNAVPPQQHAGLVYFGVAPSWNGSVLGGTIAKQGYVAALYEDVMFPSIGMLPQGIGVMAFSLSGMDYYPSAAYAGLSAGKDPKKIHIAAMGKSSLDDFCEYEAANCGNPGLRPRFGDYSQAVVSGSDIYFSNEYIQYPNCTLDEFTLDHTCGGTRGNRTNWGTSISKLSRSSLGPLD